jgi:hypothetical protein
LWLECKKTAKFVWFACKISAEASVSEIHRTLRVDALAAVPSVESWHLADYARGSGRKVVVILNFYCTISVKILI